MRAKIWFRMIWCGFGLLALLATTGAARADVIFEDGKPHVFDDTCNELWVRNNFWDEPTRVEVVSGANVNYARAYDTSELTVSGGSIHYFLRAYDSSQVTVWGGNIVVVDATESSRVTVLGGDIPDKLHAYDSSQVTISGGIIHYLWVENSSQVTVSGGSITGPLNVCDGSQVTVSGGTIGGDWAILSTLTVVGSDFSIEGRPVGLGEYDTGGRDSVYGTLSGTLLGGETFTNEFSIHGDGKLVLIPEPATLALLAVGSLVLLRRRRRLVV